MAIEFGRGMPRSTLYRHLCREGATRRKLGVSQQKIRCCWTREQAGALWVGDFEHGPLVLHQGRAVKTHLSAWVDCHSRHVSKLTPRRIEGTFRRQREDLRRRRAEACLYGTKHQALASATPRPLAWRTDRMGLRNSA